MPLASGSMIGPYEIVAPIGAGGMGEVYRARDTTLGRDVALKVLPAAFAQDQERVTRFRREAQLLASFNHPNIAAIHGLDETDGAIAIALELIEGEDLRQRLRNGQIPIPEALSIAAQIAQGLEAAHEKGIVHRDLKPANIKVTPEGQVKVLDFGLAKAFSADGSFSEPVVVVEGTGGHSPTVSWRATEAGVVLGTAAYMSPEQARGKPVDKRSDIWAFGVVMFEMLSGTRLFQGETSSDTLAAVLRQDIDWSLLPKDLSVAGRRLVERCLERDPKKRLRDIGEARIALDDPRVRIPAAPELPSADASALVSRRSWLGIAGAGAGGFAAGLALGFRSGRTSAEPPQRVSLSITPLTGSGNVIEAAISPDGRYVAYVESEQGMQSLWLKQIAGGQTLRLSADAPVLFWGHTFTPDGNGIVYGQRTADDPVGSLFQISTLGGTPKRLLTGMDSQVSFSPDGRRFAYTRNQHPTIEDSSLMVATADGSNQAVLKTFKLPEAVAGIFFGAPSWSPDGRTIATSVFRRGSSLGTATRARLLCVDVASGAVVELSDPGWVTAAQSIWLPDGRSLFVIARTNEQSNTQIWSVSYPDGAARSLTADLNDHRIVSLTRDGKSLLSVAGDVSSSIWVAPLRAGARPRRISSSRLDGFQGITFTTEGSLIYSSYVTGIWTFWKSTADGANRTPLVTAGAGDDVWSASAAPDGSFYYAIRNQAGTELRACSRDGSSTRTVVRDVRLDHVAVTPDGASVIFSAVTGGAPHLFRASTKGGERRQILDSVAFTPSLDPSGKRVAFYFVDKEGRFHIGVALLETGAILADLPAEPTSSQSKLILRDEGVYLNTMTGDRANVWLQPLDGKPARKVTNYEDQQMFEFAISPDGQSLAVVRGPRVRDAQLITGF